MSNFLTNGELRDYNSSAVVAVYNILRRQAWETMAFRTWDTMRRFLLSTLVAASVTGSLAVMLPSVAQARSYPVLSSYVPFKFQVGDHTFKPGRYDFIVAGPGVVAMRDAHEHFVASIVTHQRAAGAPVAAAKLVFDTRSKTAQLIQIWTAEGAPILDVVGEEMAVRPAAPSWITPTDVQALFERTGSPGLKY